MRLLLLFALIWSATRSSAQTDGPEADLLEAGDYAEAAERLEETLARHPSAAAYYNLALAYQELGRRGEAVWAVESSLGLGRVPGAAELSRRLSRELAADLRPLSTPPALGLWRRTATAPPDNAWATAALGTGLIGGLALSGWLLLASRPGARRRRAVATAVGVCWPLAAVFAALAFTRASLRSAPRGVLVESSTLFRAPSTGSEALRDLPAGVVLPLGERLADSYAVELPTGETGWVPTEAIRRVLSKD